MTLTLANLTMAKSIFEFESYLKKKTIDDDSVFLVCETELWGRQSVKRLRAFSVLEHTAPGFLSFEVEKSDDFDGFLRNSWFRETQRKRKRR